jgi:hypothetical protein
MVAPIKGMEWFSWGDKSEEFIDSFSDLCETSYQNKLQPF